MTTLQAETGPVSRSGLEKKRLEVERWCEEHRVDEKDAGWILGFLDRNHDASTHVEGGKLTLVTPRGRKLTYELEH